MASPISIPKVEVNADQLNRERQYSSANVGRGLVKYQGREQKTEGPDLEEGLSEKT